jgi:hypothetical protein
MTELTARREWTMPVKWGRVATRTIAVALVVLALFSVSIVAIPRGGVWDWEHFFRPATLLLIQGKNPFAVWGFFSPPWALIPLITFAVLPAGVGLLLYAMIALLIFAVAAYRFGAKPWALALLVLAPHTIKTAVMGNIDALVVLGFLLPPQIGVFLVLAKWQIGLPVALFWLVEAWRKGKLREVLRVFAPVTIVTLLSFLLYGFWPLKSLTAFGFSYNYSPFPYLLPVGFGLFWLALRRRQMRYAILSAPFLTPYISPLSISVPVLGLLPGQVATIVATVGLWLLKFIKAYPF